MSTGHGATVADPAHLASPPDYLVIGHATRDLVGGTTVVGGTAVYASITARRLGRRAAVVTNAGTDLDLPTRLPDVAISGRASTVTTTFVNEYHASGRRQRLLARAPSLTLDDVPVSWRDAPIVHLGPVAGEIDLTLAEWFAGAPGVRVLGATLQGWLRAWDDRGLVRRQALTEPERLLSRLHAAILSIEDVGGDWSAVEHYARFPAVLVVTTGATGATVFAAGKRRHVSGFPTVEVDPTGAGDVFAAAYFTRLADGDDPFAAARFANCAASFAVEGLHTTTIPSLAAVEARLLP